MKESRLNFLKRHLGPSNTDIDLMLKSMSVNTIDELIKRVIPSNILSKIDEDLIDINLSEDEVLFKLKIMQIKIPYTNPLLGWVTTGLLSQT